MHTFLRICGQWRMSGQGVVIGLDYTAMEAGLRMAGITPSDEMFAQLQLIEGGAMSGMKER